MTATDTQQPGLWSRIYLAGQLLQRDPVPIGITYRRAEALTIVSNLTTRVDRLFVFKGLPNILNRHDLTLPYSDLREGPTLEHIDLVSAIGQPFDVGIFKKTYDVFDGDGVNKDFYLQRRMLLTVLDPSFVPTVYPHWATRIATYDYGVFDPASTETIPSIVHKNSSDIDTGDPAGGEVWVEDDGEQINNFWVTKIRFGDAPGNNNDCVRVDYLPLYSCVVASESARSYGAALQEPRGLKLVEVG